MPGGLEHRIALALGTDLQDNVSVRLQGRAELPSCFAVSGLATAVLRASAIELAACTGARQVTIDRRRASLWFDMTLRPDGWALPSVWDAIAGDYRASDGWIRLHTNAPHHRAAALRVLECPADRSAVSGAVATWRRTELQDAIVAGGGAAAAMHSLSEWARHPQGRAVLDEPLIQWREAKTQGAPRDVRDLKVLDLTRVLAGPVATRFLSGFGARVLRIDPPWWTEPGIEPEVTLGKARAGLDLTCHADREIFEHLLSGADVLVHGYRPGALSGLGYDAERVRALAPGLIDVSLCAYGWSGPWAGRRGFDSLVQMSCGIAAEGMQRTGARSPVPLPVQALDHATGYLMAAAVLRALRWRNRTGRVLSAKVSLARTAALLVSEGAHDLRGAALADTRDDLDEKPEPTVWGPAHRLRFPVLVDGSGPVWRVPAGPLRVDPPRW